MLIAFPTAKFTKGLHQELAPFGVLSVDVNPSFYKTPLFNASMMISGWGKGFNDFSDEVTSVYGESQLERMVTFIVFSTSHPNIVNILSICLMN